MKKILLFITLFCSLNCFCEDDAKSFKHFIKDHIKLSEHQVELIECEIPIGQVCPAWWFYLGRKQAFEQMLEHIYLKKAPNIQSVDGPTSGINTSLYD